MELDEKRRKADKNFKVVIRIRPPLPRELEAQYQGMLLPIPNKFHSPTR